MDLTKVWIVLLLVVFAPTVMGDFGVPDEPGTDDQHLDNPRYVRLASNGSMLISDEHRILEVDAAGQIVWQIRGTFCDIEWVDNETWAALNGTSTSCDRIVFSDGRSINLSHNAQYLVRTADGLVVAGAGQNWTTEVDLQGTILHSCEFDVYLTDIHVRYFISSSGWVLYEYNLTTCAYSNISDTPGSYTTSFYPMPNGSIAYGVGMGSGNFSIVWGNWSSDVGSLPIDLSWNGTALASPIYHEHYVKVWDFAELPPLDADGDGVLDRDDACPNDWGNATDLPGCPDTDGDGTSDVNDPCPTDPLDGCVDSDGDGWNDTSDDCPTSWGNSTVDRLGCPDQDGDGTSDLNDPCPDDPLDLCNQTQPDPGQLEIVSYDWNLTNTSARLMVLLNDTCVVSTVGGSWSGSNPYTWTRTGLEPNTTYIFEFFFQNLTSVTWLNITDRTLADPEDPDPPINSWDPYVEWVHSEVGNDSAWFNYWANETVTPVLNVQLDHSWYDLEEQQFQLSLADLTPNTTYSISTTFFNEHNGSVVLWENFTTREAVYPWPPDGDGDHGGDGGLLDAAPGGVPLTYILLSLVIVAGLSAAIAWAAPHRLQLYPSIRPPRVPAPLLDVPWADTDLDELEAPLEEVADPTIPLASPDLFARLPLVPAPGKMFLPEAPSPVPRDMPYLAIQVAEAEDLPMILESLKGRVLPEISEENHKVLKDVLDMEKRLRQLRDDRDIAGRQYEKLLQQVEDLKRAVQNLTPVMERRGWDV